MTSSHTPGPWFMGNDTQDGTWEILGRNSRIAMIIPHIKDFRNDELAKSNARLIAAAPELLEACKAMQRCKGNLPQELWKKYCEPAIAKAEGTSFAN